MNPRKGKICYILWITKDEENFMMQNFRIPTFVWRIINKAFKRGDFKKKWNYK